MSQNRPVLATAASRGNRRNTLVRLRDVVAWSIDHSEAPRDVAALGRLMMGVLDEIEACPAPVTKKREATPLDEFTEHLRAKRAAQDQNRAAGS